MSQILNLIIGFLMTGAVVVAVVFFYNRFSKGGGIATLGRGEGIVKNVTGQ